jgi:phosphate-selective porin OprO and OprP
LHTGISYSYREIATVTSGTRYQVRQRPDAHLAKYVVDTGNITTFANANRINSLNPEMAFVYGPFSVQSEYEWAYVNTTNAGSAPFDGGYIYVSYFLTGENRVYNRREAVFYRIKPFENFFRVRDEDGCVRTGKGAWELAYRVDYLNLNTMAPGAGRMVDNTIGVNWYLTAYARLMLNYVHSEVTDRVVAGKLPGRAICDVIETRVQFDF